MNKRSEWESVERSELWNLSEGQTKIMPWLLLSFNHLPNASVKQCFSHCSVGISKGGNISEAALISNWIAQGFIQQSEAGDIGMVAMGQKYIKSMLANGLLQLVKRSDGFHFSMHDLMHGLALYVSRDACLIIRDPNDLHKASSRVEHVRISATNAWSSQLRFPEGSIQSTLRTLLCFGATFSKDLVAQARCLRQLHLMDCGLKEIPSSIGRLKHLRILYLDGNPFEYLPESIGRLYYLRVLSLQRCHKINELPQTITKLLNLRTLSTTTVVPIPKGMGRLRHLTWLPIVKVKAGDVCKIKELHSLVHLTGKVVIKQLENIRCKEDAKKARLEMKAGITDLKLNWTSKGHEGDTTCSNDEEVMEGLQPHSNLQVLRMENFRGPRFSPWLSNGVYCSNLRDIALVGCRRCEQLPTLGILPLLKFLLVDGMESVEVMGKDFFYPCDQPVAASSSSGSSHYDMSESNIFPQLQRLNLKNIPKLKDWFDPSGSCASVFPYLEELHIVDCPLLVSVPSCFCSLKRLTITGIHSGQPLLLILCNSNNLTSLEVENVQQLTCLSEPLLKCTSLEQLRISYCKGLVELPPTLQSLHNLQILHVEYCDCLTSFPAIEGLSSLHTLKICWCNNIIDAPSGLESCVSLEKLHLISCSKMNFIPDLASLSSLKVLMLVSLLRQMSVPRWINHLSGLSMLSIGGFHKELDNFYGIDLFPKCLRGLGLVGWPKLKSLPIELQSLTQLENLHLAEFDGVEALPDWLSNLSSLQLLGIFNCQNMKHLPSLDAMRSLTQLRKLVIERCPLLEERCGKEGGKEWHKISHLSIWINKIKVT